MGIETSYGRLNEQLRVASSLADRAELAEKARALEAVDAQVIRVNELLTHNPRLRILPTTRFHGGPTAVYEYDTTSDTVRKKSELTTAGRGITFVTDRLVIADDDSVVAVNKESGFGIPLWGFDVDTIVNQADVRRHQLEDHAYLLQSFADLKPGESRREDHIYP